MAAHHYLAMQMDKQRLMSQLSEQERHIQDLQETLIKLEYQAKENSSPAEPFQTSGWDNFSVRG